jgi:hypothetical protein
MSYSLPAASEYDAGSPITTGLMSKIINNVPGLAAGDAGKVIVQGAMATSSVGQGELKTTTASHSGTGSTEVTLTGGQYSWWTGGIENDGATTSYSGLYKPTAAGKVYVNCGSSGSPNGYAVYEQYVQASPPYGDGIDIYHLFMFLLVDASMNIKSVSVAPCPTWAYNGPTNIITTHYTKNREPCKLISPIEMEIGEAAYRAEKIRLLKSDLPADISKLEAMERRRIEEKPEEIILTPQYKNADIDICPHPWYSLPLQSGESVIMLDPVTAHRLLEIKNEIDRESNGNGALYISDLIKDGTIKIKSEVVRVAPAGMKVFDFKL